MSDDTFAVTCVIHDLQESDVTVRRKAAKMIATAAKVLGPEKCVTDFLPYVEAVLEDSDDEVLETIARELGHFYDVLGPSGVMGLYPLFGALCGNEEMKVRQAAVDSVTKLLQQSFGAGGGVGSTLYTAAMGFVTDLCGAPWAAQRCSAASLLPGVLNTLRGVPGAEGDYVKIWSMMESCVQFPDPLVRRAACSSLTEVDVRGAPENEKLLIRLVVASTKDTHDSVRIISVAVLARCAMNASPAVHPPLLECITALRKDESWRVRYALATELSLLGNALGPTITSGLLCDILTEQHNDTEKELRQAFAQQLAGLAALLTPDQVVTYIVPCCAQYVHDNVENVRIALSGCVVRVATRLPPQLAQQQMLPILIDLLGDESCDVRLAILHDIGDLLSVLPLELLSKALLKSFAALYKDQKWRARQRTLSEVDRLGTKVGAPYFENNFLPFVLELLVDKVYAVRVEAINTLEKVSKSFGPSWASNSILPKIVPLSSNPNYLNRTAALYAYERLARSMTPESVEADVLPAVSRSLKDPIPNVRFVALRVLLQYLQWRSLQPLVRKSSIIRDQVHALETDDDPEVRATRCEVALLLEAGTI